MMFLLLKLITNTKIRNTTKITNTRLDYSEFDEVYKDLKSLNNIMINTLLFTLEKNSKKFSSKRINNKQFNRSNKN